MRWAFATGATAMGALIIAATASAFATTTVVAFPGLAREFDFASGRVAWIDTAWALRVRTVRTGAQRKILYTNPYEEAQDLSGRPRLVLKQRQLLWLSTRALGSADFADDVFTATVDAERERRIARARYQDGLEGSYVTGIAGDAFGFSYSVVTVKQTALDEPRYRAVDGAVWSVSGGRIQRLPGTPPAIVLGRAGGRLAIALVDTAERQSGTPVSTGTVEIRSATTGALVSSFSAGGIRAFALSAKIAAVLTGRRIARYDVVTGQLLGSSVVPADTAADLDIEGQRIVFRRTRSIGLLNAATGRVSTLVVTPWRPTDVRIAGQNVAWAETRRIAAGEVSKKTFRARIRTLALPSA